MNSGFYSKKVICLDYRNGTISRGMFTVKQLSRLAGVTPRTLHHYDAIGLLKPSQVGENGYRYYGDESMLRHDFEALPALESHKLELNKRIARLQRLIGTVDNTISHLKGEKEMSDKQIFSGFSEEQQEKYAAEAEQMYDPETVRASNRKWKGYSADEKQRILDEGRQIYQDMIAVMPKGPASAEAQAIVARWRKNMDYFWTPNLEQLVGIANGYSDDPRFKANFDAMHPDLAHFMQQAVAAYAARQQR